MPLISFKGRSMLFFVILIWIHLPQCVYTGTISRDAESPAAGSTSSLHEASDNDAEDLFEGDIMRWPKTMPNNNPTQQEAATIFQQYLWPNGVVPLQISGDFDENTTQFVRNVAKEFEMFTCIKFPNRVDETDFVEIVGRSAACKTYVGRQGGRQKIHLNNHCMDRNSILHELMHTLGFFHEQNRPDRDEYVEIIWDNILDDKKKNFKKLHNNNVTISYTPYDFYSVMHYPKQGSSKNEQDTIRPLVRNAMIKALGLSTLDKHKLNCVYKCANYENCEPYHDHHPQKGKNVELTVVNASSSCDLIIQTYKSRDITVRDCFQESNTRSYWRIENLLSWHNAELYCNIVERGHLISVHNFHEKTILNNLAMNNDYYYDDWYKNGIWTGMYRQNFDCSKPFIYTDGSAADYMDFLNNFLGRESRCDDRRHCVQVAVKSKTWSDNNYATVGFGWNDASCSLRVKSICKQ